MFLKSLELNGFKSFAEKTVLDFPDGITAIVGPNGSGKSNLIDAIRWLLGEREAKNLRGIKTEDLIFNGTPGRPRVSQAQASLSFDNHSGFFPIDYKDVTVMRRVNRDGTSNFFLNKVEVRLKDVVDFFSRSRLGTKGLIIINQGNSDLFVRVTPEERRVMIEEILGLREYQIKKTEALRKLKATSFNLEKVKSMTEEVVPRLKLLNRQANKWSKRIELHDELQKIEHGYFAFTLHKLITEQAEYIIKIKALDAELSVRGKELTVAESALAQIEETKKDERVSALKKQESALLEKRSALQKDLGRLEARLEFLNVTPDKRVFGGEELVQLVTEIQSSIKETLRSSHEENIFMGLEKVRKILGKLSDKIDAFFNSPGEVQSKELIALEDQKTRLTADFTVIEKDLEKIREDEARITSMLEEFNDRFRASFEAMRKKRDEIIALQQQKNEIIFKESNITQRLQGLDSELLELGRARKDFESLETMPEYSSEEVVAIEKRMRVLRAELSAIGEIDEGLMKEASEVAAHYEFLVSQSKDLERAAIDLKKMIKELQVKIQTEFNNSIKNINEQFNNFFNVMFGGGSAKLKVVSLAVPSESSVESAESAELVEAERREEESVGVEIELHIPRKRVTNLEMLSGGEKSLVSIAALFALIAVSPPPFLVLDEIDAPLDESNSKRFSHLIKEFSKKTQFVIVTHNRTTMEAADVLYGVTVGSDGTSKILSLKLEAATS